MPRLLVDFSTLPAPDPAFGGKGNGLLRAASLGFRTPETVCITTHAFSLAMDEVVGRASSLEELQQELLEAPLPDALHDQLRRYLALSPYDSFAVRSSAVEEDHVEHSFAGIQHSFLGVQGLEAVSDAIRRVWASLFSQEALLYRANLDVEVVPDSIAVLVQRMIHPDVAGVLFTTNPMTADPTESIVSATEGLGDDVATGASSDTYYIEKPSGYLRRASRADAAAPALGDELLAALARLATRAELAGAGPQDIEWALAPEAPLEELDERLYLLQMRDVTTSKTAPPASVWSNTNVGEALPGVGTPLTWSIIRRFARRGFVAAFGSLGLQVPEEYELVGSFRGRVYLNLTQFMSIASAIPLMRPESLLSVGGGGGARIVRDTYEPRGPGSFLKNLPLTIPRIAASQLSMPVVSTWWRRRFLRRSRDFFARDLTRKSHTELRAQLDTLDQLFDQNGLITLAVSSNFLMSYLLVRGLLGLLLGEEVGRSEQQLFAGLQVRSAKPGLDLLALGRLARRSLRLRRLLTTTPPERVLSRLQELQSEPDVSSFLAALQAFRQEHGHRAPREAELATPRWREDTTFLFEVIRGFVESPHLPSPREIVREQRRARSAAENTLRKTLAPPLRVVARALLAFARQNARQREELRALVVDSLDMYRRFFLECGRRLTEAGLLMEPEAVFFLRYDEVRTWLEDPALQVDLRKRAIVRAAVYDAFRALPDPPGSFVLSGRELIPEESFGQEPTNREDADLTLFGLPGSAGVVTGRARVLQEPLQDSLEPGEVLVVPYADVGWTPLFLSASAVVMSLGGPLSHACIVAREYGIPAVVNAHDATLQIQTGDLITVDGDRGLVFVRVS